MASHWASDGLYCEVRDCDDPKNPGFPRPVAGHGKGLCSTHLKQLQRRGRTTAIAEKLSLEERALIAADALVEAGDDDDEYELRRERALAAFRALGLKEHSRLRSKAIAAGLARAKAEGRRPGPRPKLAREEILRVLGLMNGDTARAARVLSAAHGASISRWTVWRAARAAAGASSQRSAPSHTAAPARFGGKSKDDTAVSSFAKSGGEQ